MYNKLKLIVVLVLLPAISVATEKSSRIVTINDIEWGYLNPLRGDLSPGAANLWGDRTKDVSTGMLVRFKKGFQSPPHIHNITYRGVVITGLLHNDDPEAEKLWMPTGSFWTQPSGENHITAANGEANLIYLEIDSGPYLVKPADQAFDDGERAINLHKDNIVWLDNKQLKGVPAKGVEQSFVWGSPSGSSGSMIKLQSGFKGSIVTDSGEFKAVVVSGNIQYESREVEEIALPQGSFFESSGDFVHDLENKGQNEAIIYIRTNSDYLVK
jgi:hypothetical protein